MNHWYYFFFIMPTKNPWFKKNQISYLALFHQMEDLAPGPQSLVLFQIPTLSKQSLKFCNTFWISGKKKKIQYFSHFWKMPELIITFSDFDWKLGRYFGCYTGQKSSKFHKLFDSFSGCGWSSCRSDCYAMGHIYIGMYSFTLFQGIRVIHVVQYFVPPFFYYCI